ncbi:hypothetical protein AVEN_233326-1 [Araneus ventricosus]|uniref:Uncharacterized protein n=1 Tax=Araneus ventricosus TaxID=182803 RepID=A0A4Y2GIV5_ARAVE|nr:hypothetical protein AVEN_233326-1 [Araneus ventricosus]
MALQSTRNVLDNPTWLSRNGGKSSGGTDQYSAVLEELRKSIPAEEDFDALYLDGKVTEYSDQETDSETDMVGWLFEGFWRKGQYLAMLRQTR